MLQSGKATHKAPKADVSLYLRSCSLYIPSVCLPVSLQREKHKLSPNRNQQVYVRKVRTRREEWERRKMGIEFMSDAKRLDQAGSAKEDRRPRGFVILLS